MAVRLKLVRLGSNKRPFYRLVAAEAKGVLRGKFVDLIGYYDPMKKPAVIQIDKAKALYWLQRGAQPTDRVRALLVASGIVGKAR